MPGSEARLISSMGTWCITGSALSRLCPASGLGSERAEPLPLLPFPLPAPFRFLLLPPDTVASNRGHCSCCSCRLRQGRRMFGRTTLSSRRKSSRAASPGNFSSCRSPVWRTTETSQLAGASQGLVAGHIPGLATSCMGLLFSLPFAMVSSGPTLELTAFDSTLLDSTTLFDSEALLSQTALLSTGFTPSFLSLASTSFSAPRRPSTCSCMKTMKHSGPSSMSSKPSSSRNCCASSLLPKLSLNSSSTKFKLRKENSSGSSHILRRTFASFSTTGVSSIRSTKESEEQISPS
mmetsp:Transcript_39647/g.91619  ORF Transcript_39647/g.91619 Transcript_39647/m.91619 type:complete len:292 (+) Transcript_39647:1628-2503(+)